MTDYSFIDKLDIFGELFILEATFLSDDINWEWTISTRLAHPIEMEFTVYENVKPIKLNIYKHKDFK